MLIDNGYVSHCGYTQSHNQFGHDFRCGRSYCRAITSEYKIDWFALLNVVVGTRPVSLATANLVNSLLRDVAPDSILFCI